MKNKLCKFIAIFTALILLMLCSAIPSSANTTVQDMYLRVGLYYNRGTQLSVNAFAENGFIFGRYANMGHDFVPVYNVGADDRFIACVADKTVYMRDNALSETDYSGLRIGAYHLEAAAEYSTEQSVRAAADSVKNMGYMAFPAYTGTSYKLRVGAYSSAEEAATEMSYVSNAVGQNVSIVGEKSNVITVVNMNTGDIIFEFDCDNAYGYTFAARPQYQPDAEFSTMKHGSYRYRGTFEYQLKSGKINLVNVLEMQEYLYGVLSYEIYPSWPLEVQKAHALISRTYALSHFDKHLSKGYNVCSSDNCQVYYGCGRENDVVRQAVDETKGMVITYNGELADTYFFSASGGYTESSSNVWGGESKPYLQPVRDYYEDTNNVSNGAWSFEVTPEQLGNVQRQKGRDFVGDVTNLYVDEYTSTGNVQRVHVTDSRGKTLTFSTCEKSRAALSGFVKSSRFIIIKVYSDGTQEIAESAQARNVRTTLNWSNIVTGIPDRLPNIDMYSTSAMSLTGLTANAFAGGWYSGVVYQKPAQPIMITKSDGTAYKINDGAIFVIDGYSNYVYAMNQEASTYVQTEDGVTRLDESLGTPATPTPTPVPTSAPGVVVTATPTPMPGEPIPAPYKQDNFSDVALNSDNSPSSGSKKVVKYIIEGRGWGHSVGLSQEGAHGMAVAGYSFDQIIRYYYTGVGIAANYNKR